MTQPSIRPGERVEVKTAHGDWRPATALTAVEGTHDYSKSPHGRKIHDFPVIWVGFDGNPHKVPWPADSVRLAPGWKPQP